MASNAGMNLPAYNPASDSLPLSDEELDQLDQILTALPRDAAMTIEALDGYLAALLLSPVPLASLPGDAWLPAVWGQAAGEPDPFTSGKQRKKLQLLVLRHLRAIDAQWRLAPHLWQPLLSVVEDGAQEWVDAEDWCVGFMLGVDLAADAWTPCFEDPAQASALAPIALLGGNESEQDAPAQQRLTSPAERDAISREVVAGVMALVASRYLAPP